MRFWLQAVKLSPSVSYRFIVNDKEVTSGEVKSQPSVSAQLESDDVLIVPIFCFVSLE